MQPTCMQICRQIHFPCSDTVTVCGSAAQMDGPDYATASLAPDDHWGSVVRQLQLAEGQVLQVCMYVREGRGGTHEDANTQQNDPGLSFCGSSCATRVSLGLHCFCGVPWVIM
jgi:hypothetical protein